MSAGLDRVRAIAVRLVERFRETGRMVATAESCTGGMIAAFLTDVPGSSAVLERGFVTYSNAAKTETIGVSAAAIAAHGAVSEAVARQMAQGALAASAADVAVAVTGIAGPGGGSETKPVGLVHFALADRNGTEHRVMQFGDQGRDEIRLAAVASAFGMLETWLDRQDAAATAP